MRNRKCLIGGVLSVVVLLGAALILQQWVSAAQIFTLAVSGEPGRIVAGVVTVDGVTHRPRGMLPVSFEYRAKRIEYAFALVDGSPGAQISVAVSVGGNPWGNCTSSGGVQGSNQRLGLVGWGSVVGDLGGLSSDKATDIIR